MFANLFAITSNPQHVEDVKELVLTLLEDDQLEASFLILYTAILLLSSRAHCAWVKPQMKIKVSLCSPKHLIWRHFDLRGFPVGFLKGEFPYVFERALKGEISLRIWSWSWPCSVEICCHRFRFHHKQYGCVLWFLSFFLSAGSRNGSSDFQWSGSLWLP